MNVRSLLHLGIVGSIVTAICCFTPLLVVLLGMAGLTALIAYLDMILLPALAVFIAITLIAFVQQRRNT